MSPQIRALIFDVDGVLVDTVELHFQSWKFLTDEAGIAFSREDNDALRGVSRRKGLDFILKGQAMDGTTAEDWMRRKNEHFLESLARMTPADRLPGVTELIEEARAAGLKLGIASASRNARAVLEQLALSDTFEAVADAHCAVNTKPAPDLFLWAAGRLGVCPAEAIVLEDSEAGVLAGRNGGFWTVGIGSERVIGAAHLVLPSLQGVTLNSLLDRIKDVAGE